MLRRDIAPVVAHRAAGDKALDRGRASAKIAAMRAVPWIACAGLLASAAGCGGAAQAASVDGTLVLELGGPHASLRDTLLACGIVIEPATAALSRRGPPPPQGSPVEPRTAPTPRPEPSPPSEPARRTEPPRATSRLVTLQPDENLVQLARRHLGDGNRYREILALNGWTEARARRLAPGTEVRIPIDPR
jgi:nucleoid-associated protein YgaU